VKLVLNHQLPVAHEERTVFVQVKPGSRRCDASFEPASSVRKKSALVHVLVPQQFEMLEELDVENQSTGIKYALHLLSN
jgi:hypothetical protein